LNTNFRSLSLFNQTAKINAREKRI